MYNTAENDCFLGVADEPAQRNRAVNREADGKGKQVKLSHTRYRALGPELIPVYRQSARR